MFIFLFFSEKYGAVVRTRIVYKSNPYNHGLPYPNICVESIDSKIEVLAAAKTVFDDKAMAFINRNFRREQ
jgi:hypothetical protein